MPKHLLVVDDDPGCRNLLADLFADCPDRVLTFATNGAEAWWALTGSTQRFDLLICDLQMPVVNGIGLLQRLREHPSLNTLPVIMCTGMRTRETITMAAGLGVAHYITKPYLPSVMMEKIDSLLESRQGVA